MVEVSVDTECLLLIVDSARGSPLAKTLFHKRNPVSDTVETVAIFLYLLV